MTLRNLHCLLEKGIFTCRKLLEETLFPILTGCNDLCTGIFFEITMFSRMLSKEKAKNNLLPRVCVFFYQSTTVYTWSHKLKKTTFLSVYPLPRRPHRMHRLLVYFHSQPFNILKISFTTWKWCKGHITGHTNTHKQVPCDQLTRIFTGLI